MTNRVDALLAEMGGGQSRVDALLAEMGGDDGRASVEDVLRATDSWDEPDATQPQPQPDMVTMGAGRTRRSVPLEQIASNNQGNDALLAAYETIKALGLGGAAGTFGQLGGTVEGMIKAAKSGEFGTARGAESIRQLAEQRAEEFSRPFMPESELGIETVETIGEQLSRLPVIPQIAVEAPILAQASKIGLQIQANKVRELRSSINESAQVVRDMAKARNSAFLAVKESEKSAGAAQVGEPVLRQQAASQLPVPIDLTEGQATRTFEQQRFERETAKLPEPGKPLRERFADQNAQLIQNFDAFLDETGADLYYPMEIGEAVEKAVRADAAKDMNRIRALYNEARRSGEMNKNVNLSPLADYLNANRAERAENSIMSKVQRQIEVLEVGDGTFEDGSLELNNMNLNQAEAIRRFINRNINDSDPNDIRIGASLKNVIDASTADAGGEKYKAARRARFEYAEKFENVSLINNILSTKRGTTDRVIALEDVARKSILSPSTPNQSTRHLKKLLQNAGPEGVQAWKELQGYTIRHLQDQMTRNVARNERGDPVVSAAMLDREIKALDKSEKLDLLFGKKGAETLRTVNDVAKVVLTSPPGAVNTSNTATVMAGLMDIAISGSAGVPAPLMTTFRLLKDSLKDKALKKRVDQALNYRPENQ